MTQGFAVFPSLLVGRTGDGWHLRGLGSNTHRPSREPATVPCGGDSADRRPGDHLFIGASVSEGGPGRWRVSDRWSSHHHVRRLPRPVFVFGNKKAKTIHVPVIASAEKFGCNVACGFLPAGKWSADLFPVKTPKAQTARSQLQVSTDVHQAVVGEGELCATSISRPGQRTKALSSSAH